MPTSITRWRPFEELGVRDRFDRMFEDLSRLAPCQPDFDIIRKNGSLVLKADLPGFKPGDVKIEIEGRVLTVTGERDEKKEEKKEDYICHERRYGKFERVMTLPEGVKPTAADATFHDGVLELTIPIETKSEQKIEIKAKTS